MQEVLDRTGLQLTPSDFLGSTSSTEVELTILMPCLNEAETIERCVAKAVRFLAENNICGEVLVADNGSSDGSQELARRAGARVVEVSAKGYGAALQGGVRAARGRYVIMGDSDDSYDFLNLGPFLDALRAGNDLVMGNRFLGGIKPGAMPFLHRRLGNPVLSFLGRRFFQIPIGDFHCGLRGFSRQAVLDLHLSSPGMEFASEMVVKASLNRLRLAEVPTTLSKDGRSRPPHLKTWRDGWRHLRFLLLHSPKWLFFYPGLAIMALGIVGFIVLLPGAAQVTNAIELDINSLLVAGFSILLGTQLISFSVLARSYAAAEGFLPPIVRASGLIRFMNLERWLQLASVLLVFGTTGIITAFVMWAQSGFGPIEGSEITRLLILCLTLFALGIQLGSSAFLASVFRIRRGTSA